MAEIQTLNGGDLAIQIGQSQDYDLPHNPNGAWRWAPEAKDLSALQATLGEREKRGLKGAKGMKGVKMPYVIITALSRYTGPTLFEFVRDEEVIQRLMLNIAAVSTKPIPRPAVSPTRRQHAELLLRAS